MKTMPNRRTWLTEERERVADRIATAYGLNWQKAVQEHPDWYEIIGKTQQDHKNLYNTLQRFLMHRQGKTGRGTTMKNLRSSVSQPGNRESVMRAVIENYTVEGTVKWARAMKEHPEWADALGWNNPTVRTGLYSAAAWLIKKDDSYANLRKPEPAPEPVAPSNGAHEPAQPDPMSLVRFCPQCGFNLMILKTAFTVALKHSLKK